MPISSRANITTTVRIPDENGAVPQSRPNQDRPSKHSAPPSKKPEPQPPASPTPECFRARNFFGRPGHHRFGIQPKPRLSQPGHYRYGGSVSEPPGGGYNGPGGRSTALYPRGVPGEYAGYNTWGPTRMGGYGWTGWTQGCCGPQTKSLRAVLIGVFAILAAAGLATGLYMHLEEPHVPYGPKGGRDPFIRVYQVNGLYVPCQDRTTTGPPKPPTTTAEPTTPPPPTPLCIALTTTGVAVTTTPEKPTTKPDTTAANMPTTAADVPTTAGPALTTQAAADVSSPSAENLTAATAANVSEATNPDTTIQVAIATTEVVPPATTAPPSTAAKPTSVEPTTVTETPVPTICFWITEGEETTVIETTTVPTTTTTTLNTLPYCDDLTTSYSLRTIEPVASGSGRPSCHGAPPGGALIIVWLATLRFFVG